MKTRISLSFFALILFLSIALPALAAVPAPTLLSPASAASVTSPFTISWSAVSDPSGNAGYNWQVSSSSAFSSVALQNSTNPNVTQDTVSGLANGTYFWRVQAVNGAFVQGAWSAPRSFNITGTGAGQPAAPVLSPTKGYSTFHPLEVMTFNWSPVAGATSYVLQFSTDPSFPVAGRGQVNNIPNTTYSFSTPDQGTYSARVIAVNANGVSGAPSNVISYSVFYNNPIAGPPSIVSPANGATVTLPLQLAWTDVLNPQPSGYEMQIAKDAGFSQIEDDVPQQNEPNRTELSLTAGKKFWRVRSAQGDASPTTAAETAWSATGIFTVNAAPPAPATITLTSNQLFSGNTVFVQIQLSGAAPAAGATINLTSSNPSALPLPATVSMPGNTAFTQFQTQIGQVTASTPVTLTATLNSGSATANVSVLPPSLKSIQLTPASISGGAPGNALITLNGQAPAGGAAINLSSSSAAAAPPAIANIAAGNTAVAVAVPTNSVAASTPATITAGWNGASVQSQFTVTPQGQPTSITLNPATVTGAGGTTGVVTMAGTATTDQFFTVFSSNPSLAQVGNEVMIPAGSTSAGIQITSALVKVQTVVAISVTGGGVTRSANLTLNPSATPTTKSLQVIAGGRSGERVISSVGGLSVATGTNGTVQIAPGTVVTLSVTNGRSAIWNGACTSNNGATKICPLTVNADSPVTANVQ
jgi:predicted secreted protein